MCAALAKFDNNSFKASLPPLLWLSLLCISLCEKKNGWKKFLLEVREHKRIIRIASCWGSACFLQWKNTHNLTCVTHELLAQTKKGTQRRNRNSYYWSFSRNITLAKSLWRRKISYTWPPNTDIYTATFESKASVCDFLAGWRSCLELDKNNLCPCLMELSMCLLTAGGK